MTRRQLVRFRALSLVEVLACIATILISAAILFPVFAESKHGGRSSCLSNVKQIALAMLMYENDAGKTPAADHWVDRCASIAKNEVIFHCPVVKKYSPGVYGYAMRTKLGGISLETLVSPATEPMCFDTELEDRNAHTNFLTIPDFTRHQGQKVGFADGHAKNLLPEAVTKLQVSLEGRPFAHARQPNSKPTGAVGRGS